MHRIAVGAFAGLAALAGCLGERTKVCANGATCPFDEACTELALDAPRLCGPERLVEQCRAQPEYTTCDFRGSADGSCQSGVCSECTVNTAGCVVETWTPMTSNTEASLSGLWVQAPGEAYAVGEDLLVVRYDGLGWRPLTLEGTNLAFDADLTGVWGTASELHLTSAGTLVTASLDGGVLTGREVATATAFLAVAGSAPDDVLAVGRDAQGAMILHYDGTTWSRETIPTPPTLALVNAVWAVDRETAWAAGNDGTVLQRTAAGWTVSRTREATDLPLLGIWGTTDEAYAVGGESSQPLFVLHYRAGTWTRVTNLVGLPPVQLGGVWGSGSRVFAAGGAGLVLSRDTAAGEAWASEAATTVDLATIRGLEGPRGLELFGVGLQGTIVRRSVTP